MQEHDRDALAGLLARQRARRSVDRQLGHALGILVGVIFDTTEATFEQDVIERSHELPVVVDFWAEWCGAVPPAHARARADGHEREGKVALAKLDTDANQRLAAAFGIQGIPAVKAFKDGRVVAEFVGAQPPPQVERFFDELLPSEADALVEAGDEAALRRALELEPGARRRRASRSPAAARARRRRRGAAAARATSPARSRPTGSPPASGSRATGAARGVRRARRRRARARTRRADRRDRRHDDDDRREDLRRAVVGVLDDLGVEHPLARESRAQARLRPVLAARRAEALGQRTREALALRGQLVVVAAGAGEDLRHRAQPRGRIERAGGDRHAGAPRRPPEQARPARRQNPRSRSPSAYQRSAAGSSTARSSRAHAA